MGVYILYTCITSKIPFPKPSITTLVVLVSKKTSFNTECFSGEVDLNSNMMHFAVDHPLITKQKGLELWKHS